MAEALRDAEHALTRQAVAPRCQTAGHDNLDGWGVAWWASGSPGPNRYRTTAPMADDTCVDQVATTVATAFLAAVRLASPGTTISEANTAPFVSGPWAFSLNGFCFDGDRADRLRSGLSQRRAASVAGDTDTEVLFALVLDALDAGLVPGAALASVTRLAAPDADTRLNLLLTDGRTIAATAWGNSLFVRPTADAVDVASEPWDSDPDWRCVPDRTLLSARPGDVTLTGLGEQ